MSVKTYFLVLLLTLTVFAVKKSYEGYKVYKVVPQTKDAVEILTDIQISGVGEFWTEQFDVNQKVQIMVAKQNQAVFLERMKSAEIETNEIISDLQKIINNQLTSASTSRIARNTESLLSMNWVRYHTLEEINNWLDELESAYPDIVTTVNMGESFEEREIKGIIINYNPERTNRFIGMLEGTLHAREWISPATVTWIIKEFLTSTDPEVRAMAENLEWHIFPVVNPDGYAYSFTNDRMWRKNRNPSYNVSSCAAGADMSNGVDLNRNFGYMWMLTGASDDPCSNLFAGPAEFSEPEARVIADYVTNLHDQGKLIYYLAYHSFTQLVVIPFSHVAGGHDVLEASNFANMYEIGIRAAEALRQRFETEYSVGVAADVLYPMSGTSFDWVKNVTDVPVCYLIELRDLGDYGFLLPEEQIIPNNLETMDFLLEMDRTTRHLGYYSSATSVLNSVIIIVFGVSFAFFVN